jgi:Aldo/keto reductase family
VDLCLDAGVNLVDTANVYSAGQSEEIVGQVMKGRWERALIATKVRMPMGKGANDHRGQYFGGEERTAFAQDVESGLEFDTGAHAHVEHGKDGQRAGEQRSGERAEELAGPGAKACGPPRRATGRSSSRRVSLPAAA